MSKILFYLFALPISVSLDLFKVSVLGTLSRSTFVPCSTSAQHKIIFSVQVTLDKTIFQMNVTERKMHIHAFVSPSCL